MSRKQKLSFRGLVFWSIIALLTLIFIVLVIVRFFSSRETTFSDNLINLKEDRF